MKLCRGYSSCQHFPLRDFSRSNWPKIWTMLSGELNFSCLDESSFVNAGMWGGFGDWEGAPDEIMASTECIGTTHI